jgi:hypothetical protein
VPELEDACTADEHNHCDKVKLVLVELLPLGFGVENVPDGLAFPTVEAGVVGHCHCKLHFLTLTHSHCGPVKQPH